MSEITWSLMHPTPLDAEYMRCVVKEADKSPVKVDSFEICAQCHGLLGGLDGLGFYDRYSSLQRDRQAVAANIAALKEVLKIAHDSGRPVYYWHREVTVPDGLVKLVPELLDERGEFDLLGSAFEELLRYKFQQAFENVPELDGIVLTLTEADYSAIHNSRPDVYPPEQVVAKVAGIFAEELQKRGKRFILRSFGSIAKDYEDILAGAALLEKQGIRFEVETKITPYDFDPFLPENPFLRHTGSLTLGAECDSLGEFLGAGYLPAENTVNILRWVKGAQKAGVDRFAIRCDRIGNNVFDRYPLNLYTYMRAISDSSAEAEQIEDEFFARYPEKIRGKMKELSRLGLDAILKTNYMKGNLVFHQFPPKVSLKYLKAGGFFGCFKEHVPLKALSGIWSILAETPTGSRADLLAEKRTAVSLVEKGIGIIEGIKEELGDAEYGRLKELWYNLSCASECLFAFCSCVTAYFDDMERLSPGHPKLSSAMKKAETVFLKYDSAAKVLKASDKFVNGMERNSFQSKKDIADVYPRPLRGMLQLICEEYDAELAARSKHADWTDLFIPGSITDEWRCERVMHGCHATLQDGRLCRIIGNQVFPNGTLGFELNSETMCDTVFLSGEGHAEVAVNGQKRDIELSAETALKVNAGKTFHIVIRGLGGTYPVLCAAGLQKQQAMF